MSIFKDLDDIGQAYLKDLVDQIKRGQCVLFIGSGVSSEVGLPAGWELTATLAQEINIPPTTLSQISQAYETRFDRSRLIQRLRQLIEERSVVSRGVTSYDLLPEIKPFRTVFTTNWDDQIERAFHRKDIPLVTARYNEHLALISNEMRVLVKLHGDFNNKPEEILLTRDDYVRAYKEVTKPAGLFNLLAGALSTTTVLFVGYSLEDGDFRLLYDYVREAMGAGLRTHYAVMPRASYMLKKEWQNRNIVILETTARNLLEYIAHQVRDFFNREDEIRYVVGPAAKPFTEFYSVAGSGKTELLKKIEDQYRLGGVVWLRAFVSFEEKPGLTPLDLAKELSRQTLNYGLEDPLQRAKDEFTSGEVSEDQAVARAGHLAADDLGKAWANRRVVLLFDASEQMPEPLQRWVEKELIPALRSHLMDLKWQVRVVFAGRKPMGWENVNLKSNLNSFSLSPFDETTVGEMLDWFAALRLNTPLPPEKRRRIIQDILDITGGHPGCIKKVLEHLADRDFDVQADYVYSERKTLFEKFVYPTLEKEILSKVPPELRPPLEIVSVFRRLLPDTLDVLTEKKYLDQEYGPAFKLLGNLRETYLVSSADRSQVHMYDLDATVKHILALRMELSEFARYRKLNALALAFYDQRVIGKTTDGEELPPPPSNELLVAYIVEAMYHLLVQARLDYTSSDEIQLNLKNKLGEYLEAIRGRADRSELFRLLDLLEAKFGANPGQTDHELLDLTVNLVPEDGYQMFLEPVKAFRKQAEVSL